MTLNSNVQKAATDGIDGQRLLVAVEHVPPIRAEKMAPAGNAGIYSCFNCLLQLVVPLAEITLEIS